jgi:hypothetical protein
MWGHPRDAMIHEWCVSVWEAFGDVRSGIVQLIADET